MLRQPLDSHESMILNIYTLCRRTLPGQPDSESNPSHIPSPSPFSFPFIISLARPLTLTMLDCLRCPLAASFICFLIKQVLDLQRWRRVNEGRKLPPSSLSLSLLFFLPFPPLLTHPITYALCACVLAIFYHLISHSNVSHPSQHQQQHQKDAKGSRTQSKSFHAALPSLSPFITHPRLAGKQIACGRWRHSTLRWLSVCVVIFHFAQPPPAHRNLYMSKSPTFRAGPESSPSGAGAGAEAASIAAALAAPSTSLIRQLGQAESVRNYWRGRRSLARTKDQASRHWAAVEGLLLVSLLLLLLPLTGLVRCACIPNRFVIAESCRRTLLVSWHEISSTLRESSVELCLKINLD